MQVQISSIMVLLKICRFWRPSKYFISYSFCCCIIKCTSMWYLDYKAIL